MLLLAMTEGSLSPDKLSTTLDAQLRSILDEKLEPFQALQAEMKELRTFVEEANKKYDDVVKRMADHETSSKAIAAQIKVLKSALHTMESRVNHLMSVCNDLEQYLRREWVEVQGIPVAKDEDTNNIVVKVAELMGIEIEENDISISHPSKPKLSGNDCVAGNIVLPFNKLRYKDVRAIPLFLRLTKTMRACHRV